MKINKINNIFKIKCSWCESPYKNGLPETYTWMNMIEFHGVINVSMRNEDNTTETLSWPSTCTNPKLGWHTTMTISKLCL